MEVGTRIRVKGDLGTIRYVGTLQNREGTWIGIEWDNPEKGKHSGEADGIKYFQSKLPGHATFMKQNLFLDNLTNGVSISEAVLDKYADKRELDTREMYVPTVKNSTKPIELVKPEKIQARQERIDQLKEIALQECDIRYIDESFGSMVSSCEDLLLDSNLFTSWDQVAELLSQIPHLRTLSLSYNRLEQELTRKFEHRLKVLVCIGMNLSWEEIYPVLICLREFQELLLCRNRFSVLPELTDECFGRLKLLNLEENGIENWEIVNSSCANLPSLEKIILNKNAIGYVNYTGGWRNLTAISLDNNLIDSFHTIHELQKFPKEIKELRISNNPLQSNLNVSMFRFMIIARLPGLTLLNGAALRAQERIDAERLYLRTFMDDENERRYPIWSILISKHGDPHDIGKVVSMSDAVAQQTLSNASVEVKLISLTSRTAGKELKKKLALNMTVPTVRALCSKLFECDNERMKITYREKDNIYPQELNDNMRDLSYYMIKPGGELWVEEIS
jgi:hypothetical protein